MYILCMYSVFTLSGTIKYFSWLTLDLNVVFELWKVTDTDMRMVILLNANVNATNNNFFFN